MTYKSKWDSYVGSCCYCDKNLFVGFDEFVKLVPEDEHNTQKIHVSCQEKINTLAANPIELVWHVRELENKLAELTERIDRSNIQPDYDE